MQGFICVFGVLELPVFVTLRPGFWQFLPMTPDTPSCCRAIACR
ncbi:IS1478 transposase [Xanthomonas oryzae pv. oryzae KACC 10331]|uniref:IS1478 transposase n=1 Tax=Xanthomonas oryzae pv. oryzae (strain KACC10331 / KXO85) TaxID=291331 RepID=Q5H611_XANOR|nr:IS1478 transposase [Xanthomonas oryzae pv. oryzae KACC 10331]